jgi:hypothetical protein
MKFDKTSGYILGIVGVVALVGIVVMIMNNVGDFSTTDISGQVIAARTGYCGDGVCQSTESAITCSQDCTASQAVGTTLALKPVISCSGGLYNDDGTPVYITNFLDPDHSCYDLDVAATSGSSITWDYHGEDSTACAGSDGEVNGVPGVFTITATATKAGASSSCDFKKIGLYPFDFTSDNYNHLTDYPGYLLFELKDLRNLLGSNWKEESPYLLSGQNHEITKEVSDGNTYMGLRSRSLQYASFDEKCTSQDNHLCPNNWIVVMANVYSETNNINEEDFIVGKLSNTCGRPLYALQDTADGHYKFSVSINGQIKSVTGGQVEHNWQKVLGIYDGEQIRLYVDGQHYEDAVASLSVSGPITYSSNVVESGLYIGYSPACASANGGIPYGGNIDDVFIYGN